MSLSNARIGYEPHRGDGALCISFRDKEEAIFFAEAILHEVQNIENDGLSVSECALITINFGQQCAAGSRSHPFARCSGNCVQRVKPPWTSIRRLTYSTHPYFNPHEILTVFLSNS